MKDAELSALFPGEPAQFDVSERWDRAAPGMPGREEIEDSVPEDIKKTIRDMAY